MEHSNYHKCERRCTTPRRLKKWKSITIVGKKRWKTFSWNIDFTFLSLHAPPQIVIFLVCSRDKHKYEKTSKNSDFMIIWFFFIKVLTWTSLPHSMVLRHWQIVDMNITYQNGWARWSHLPDVNIRFFRTSFLRICILDCRWIFFTLKQTLNWKKANG